MPAFPGAQGHGALAQGGRGGRVIKVTTLADSGQGSLREALLTPEPRTVIFDVAGTIELKSRIIVSGPQYSYLTIAGQNAPGDGVQIKGHELILGDSVSHVIIRYMRFRPGFTSPAEGGKFSLMISGSENKAANHIIVDHCTFSWAPDDTGMWDDVHHVTWQHSIFGEAMVHDFPGPSSISRGMIVGAEQGRGARQYNISIHNNYFVNNDQRNAAFSAVGPYEFVNNLVYNWGSFGTSMSARSGDFKINLIGNIYREGPAIKTAGRYPMAMDSSPMPDERLYVKDNLDSRYRKNTTQPEWAIMGTGLVSNPQQNFWRENAPTRHQRTVPWPAATTPVLAKPSGEVVESVLAGAGATRPMRDAQDAKLVADYRNFTGSIRRASSQKATDWPVLSSAPTATDTDGDGMPDDWERQHGLNPQDPADSARDADGDGYTNLEEFLNQTNPKLRDR